MTQRQFPRGTYTLGLVAAIAAATGLTGASCSSDPPKQNPIVTSGSGGSAGTGGSGSSGLGGEDGGIIVPEGPYKDFPPDPIVQGSLPPNIGAIFTGAGPGLDPGGPCLSEPPTDARVPRNWTPLFFEWMVFGDVNVFELKIEVDNQINPLVVYTTVPSYTMSSPAWTGLTQHSIAHDIKISIRSAKLEGDTITAGPFTGSTSVVQIAPVAAPGSVVYWSSDPTTYATAFEGFTVGDTTSKVVLTPETVPGLNAAGKQTHCISCHSSSPDGKLIFYSSDADLGNHRSVDVRMVTTKERPSTDVVSDAAYALLGRHRQLVPILSPAHYSANDAVVLTVMSRQEINNYRAELIWTDLHATDSNGWGIFARNGDPRGVSSPSWSHDGKDIAYVSSAGAQQGVIAETIPADSTMDIYVVPYNNRMGGDAKTLPGASDPQKREFYPVYSPDDTFIAFNRSDTSNTSYDAPTAELFLLPREGGTPVRLQANDPPMCTGLVSPGLTNSWARWAPTATTTPEGDKYYWIIFSSKRRFAVNKRPQLYVAAIITRVVNGKETLVAEHTPIYVGAQNPATSNHTPSWDYFVVEQIPK